MSEYAIVCYNCKELINRSSARCPNCGAFNSPMFRAFARFQDVPITKMLIGANVVIYLLSLLLTYLYTRINFWGFLNFFSPNDAVLQILGWTDPGAVSAGSYWQLLTSLFLHGGFFHLLFNMLWLYDLYPLNESFFGKLATFFVYICGGVAGSLTASIFGGSPVVGASGAIFGLLAAYITVAGQSKNVFHRIFSKRYLNLAIIMLLIGFIFPGISNLSHIGGAVGGYVSAIAIIKLQPGLIVRGILFSIALLLLILSELYVLVSVLLYLF